MYKSDINFNLYKTFYDVATYGSISKAAVVNYTNSHKYTRISEFSKFTCEPQDSTVIVKEYSKAFKKGKNIPYYPIPIAKNIAHYELYAELAKKYKNLYLLGRLANYKYINMDVAIKNAMDLYENIMGEGVDMDSITPTKKGS